MATELQTIQTLVKSLDQSTDSNGIRALDKAIRACSGYNNTSELINDFIAKCSSMQGVTNKNTINNFLKSTCGIDLFNTDTGAITGADAGGLTEKTAESVVPEYETDLQIGQNGVFRLNNTNITVKLPAYRNKSEHEVLNGLCTWWVTESIRLINESYGLYFNKRTDSTDAIIPYISFSFEYDYSSTTLASCQPSYYGEKAAAIHIRINMAKYPDFTLYKDGEYSGYTSANSFQLDRTIAHELTHALFMTNLKRSVFQSLPQFFTEGIAELVHGIDDFRRDNILDILSEPSRLIAALQLKRGTGESDAYAAGYMLLRYLAHQVSTGVKPPVITGLNHSSDNTALNVTAAYKGQLIDTYKATVQTIDATKSNRNLTIWGNSNDNTLIASSKGSTLWGGNGNDTLIGGKGADTFRFYGGEGNDTIIDYQEGKDTISLGKETYGALKSAKVTGNDVILTVGTNTLTIKDARGKAIKIVDGNDTASLSRFFDGETAYISQSGKFFSLDDNATNMYLTLPTGIVYNGAKTSVTINAKYKNDLMLPIDANEFWSTVKSISAAASKYGLTIKGNENITTITGSKYEDCLYAGNGKVTMNGGNGNDLLNGGRGTNKLYGGNGNDSIFGGEGINLLYGGNGDDTLYGGSEAGTTSTLNGDNGNDTLVAIGGISILNGGNGDDKLYGGDGTNTLKGGNGNDELHGGDGTNTLYGDNGNDKLYGGKGTNILNGGNGNDYIEGGAGSNELIGGNGNDTLVGGDGPNKLHGGAGADTLTGGKGKNTFFYANMAETKGDIITNFCKDDELYFDLKKNALDLDAIYTNFNLYGKDAKGKNTISLHGDTLTITDRSNRKYSIILSNNYSGNITIANKDQRKTFTL